MVPLAPARHLEDAVLQPAQSCEARAVMVTLQIINPPGVRWGPRSQISTVTMPRSRPTWPDPRRPPAPDPGPEQDGGSHWDSQRWLRGPFRWGRSRWLGSAGWNSAWGFLPVRDPACEWLRRWSQCPSDQPFVQIFSETPTNRMGPSRVKWWGQAGDMGTALTRGPDPRPPRSPGGRGHRWRSPAPTPDSSARHLSSCPRARSGLSPEGDAGGTGLGFRPARTWTGERGILSPAQGRRAQLRSGASPAGSSSPTSGPAWGAGVWGGPGRPPTPECPLPTISAWLSPAPGRKRRSRGLP